MYIHVDLRLDRHDNVDVVFFVWTGMFSLLLIEFNACKKVLWEVILLLLHEPPTEKKIPAIQLLTILLCLLHVSQSDKFPLAT